jgi:hypothetical protein
LFYVSAQVEGLLLNLELSFVHPGIISRIESSLACLVQFYLEVPFFNPQAQKHFLLHNGAVFARAPEA